MTSSGAIRALEAEIIGAAELLRLKLDMLSQLAPDNADAVLSNVLDLIGKDGRSLPAAQPLKLATAMLTPLEEPIVEFLCAFEQPQTIDDIFHYLSQQEDLKKPTLAVRLHRMAKDNKITNPVRGAYSVSDIVRARHNSQKSGTQ